MKPATLPKRVIAMLADLETRRAERRSSPAPCSAKRALELCELWTRRDIEQYQGAPFIKNLEHRLACIREGMADPIFQSPGCQTNVGLSVADSTQRGVGDVTAGETAASPNDETQRRLPPPESNDNTQNENGGSRSLE